MKNIVVLYSLILALLLVNSTAAGAQNTLKFGLPIACTPEIDCWILNYVDLAGDKGVVKDPACQSRSYDDHKGTDIAIRSKAVMDQGVKVLASQDGTIERVRNGEPDRFPTAEDLEQIKKDRKECGNAVLIDHGNGWKTLYCHLKKDSLSVKVGDNVKKGDPIGEVGLSGFTEFPHVHFGIMNNNKILDPFTGLDTTQGCPSLSNKTNESLWDMPVTMAYTRTSIYDAGFWSDVPVLAKIDLGENTASSLTTQTEALTFWMVFFGAIEGDAINMSILDPSGQVFAEKSITQDKTRARQFYFIGKKTGSSALMPGKYTGFAKLTRMGEEGKEEVFQIEREIIINP